MLQFSRFWLIFSLISSLIYLIYNIKQKTYYLSWSVSLIEWYCPVSMIIWTNGVPEQACLWGTLVSYMNLKLRLFHKTWFVKSHCKTNNSCNKCNVELQRFNLGVYLSLPSLTLCTLIRLQGKRAKGTALQNSIQPFLGPRVTIVFKRVGFAIFFIGKKCLDLILRQFGFSKCTL